MKVAIYGYGNLGRGVENAIAQNEDMELVAVFTRRAPESIRVETSGVQVVSAEQILDWKGKIDVLFLCGGSATDLPQMTPSLARHFNVVDSYDNHSSIPAHMAAVDAAAREGGNVALISCGWDPGMFSLNRLYVSCLLPHGETYTFWGRGVSQGHSDAIRRIEGVEDARQYTVPVEEAMDRVRRGENPVLTTREKHTRECYVVAEEGADLERIRREIVTMPAYFEPYNTTVTFITMEEMRRDHAALPHGGSVIRTGRTGKDDAHNQVVEYKLTLESNPEFTGSALVAFGRAVCRMAARGESGCKTVLDIAPVDLAAQSRDALVAELL